MAVDPASRRSSSPVTIDDGAAGSREAPVPPFLDDGQPVLRRTIPGTLLLALLAALAIFDRTAALLAVPGVPVYPAEIVLGICVLFLLTRPHPFVGVRTGRWLAPVLLLLYLAWGALKLVGSLHYPVLDVIRDSALVYYALFALVVVGLSHHDSRFNPSELVRLYGRFVPWFLAIAPIRLISSSLTGWAT
jgi:hypothetical protein